MERIVLSIGETIGSCWSKFCLIPILQINELIMIIEQREKQGLGAVFDQTLELVAKDKE